MNATDKNISEAIKQIQANQAEAAKIKAQTSFLKEILNALRS